MYDIVCLRTDGCLTPYSLNIPDAKKVIERTKTVARLTYLDTFLLNDGQCEMVVLAGPPEARELFFDCNPVLANDLFGTGYFNYLAEKREWQLVPWQKEGF